jgi:PAS domain S-box-containing protein
MDDDRRFVDVNPAACSIYGRSREEMLQVSIDDILDPASRRPAESWTTFREGDVRLGAATIVRPDGELREIEYASTPNISPHRHLSIVRDVTERNASALERLELEHRLNQAERLETVGQLAGGVAHDFNNILSIIVTFAELARTPRDEGSVHDDLAQISAAADRGRDLTRQLLIIGRRDVGQPEVFDLGALVRSIEQFLGRVIGERIRIEVRVPDEPVPVCADRGRIDQLLMNLALNARDAMPAGGTLSISVTRRPPAGGPPAVRDVELVVADTGVGMIDEVSARVFEPFYTTKEAGQGVGLGLAAVHGIVQDAGGQISLTSRLGEGTTVVVVLPGTSESPWEATAEADRPTADGGGRHVLIVEDDAQMLEATRLVLARHGYVTSTASNAEAALAELARSSVDIVVTDLVMPGMSGVGLVQRLRSEHPDIRVVCMSGYSARQGMLPDDVTLIDKPFSPQELLTAITSAEGAT